jgi:hypothetical protein
MCLCVCFTVCAHRHARTLTSDGRVQLRTLDELEDLIEVYAEDEVGSVV